ncbi:hypothetical protein J2S10_005285 [Neobacillus ginsengisoli]|uniref:Uncharacterized protein n=1 Tax=Neobacillus ginsengisoli TaxID=904295 RepID=A0ABT9Y2L7_9BACI|nr:hypothetical protein [Neobacillus ginsengisoli]
MFPKNVLAWVLCQNVGGTLPLAMAKDIAKGIATIPTINPATASF